MQAVFGDDVDYPRGGLAIVGIGMGAHLVAGTLNQALLARGAARAACAAWAAGAVVFVAWMLAGAIDDVLLRAEIGYTVCAILVAAEMVWLYMRGARRA